MALPDTLAIFSVLTCSIATLYCLIQVSGEGPDPVQHVSTNPSSAVV